MKTCLSVFPLLGIVLTASAGHFDGSRTVPVHRIPITAEDGEQIIPTMPQTMPLSSMKTCGACHDYETIDSGTHFGGAGRGRATEPWIAVESTHKKLPVYSAHADKGPIILQDHKNPVRYRNIWVREL